MLVAGDDMLLNDTVVLSVALRRLRVAGLLLYGVALLVVW